MAAGAASRLGSLTGAGHTRKISAPSHGDAMFRFAMRAPVRPCPCGPASRWRRARSRSRRRWSASTRSGPRSTRSRRRRGAAGTAYAALTDLSQRLSPLRDQLRDKIADLEPRLADLDARLKGLGPAPAKDAPPEDAAIAAERARLTQQRAEIDAAIKQVQLLQTRAEQLANAAVGPAPLGLCGDAVPPFAERARSLLLARRRRGGARLRGAASSEFGRDGIAYARDKGGSARMASAGLALAGLAPSHSGWSAGGAGSIPVTRVGARYGNALAALLVFARSALTTPLAVFVVLELLDQFELIPPTYDRLIRNLIVGVAIAALARAAATQRAGAGQPAAPPRRLRRCDRAMALLPSDLGRTPVRRADRAARDQPHGRSRRR